MKLTENPIPFTGIDALKCRVYSENICLAGFQKTCSYKSEQ